MLRILTFANGLFLAALELILKRTAGKYTFGDEITLVRASQLLTSSLHLGIFSNF